LSDDSALERVLEVAPVDAAARFCGVVRLVDGHARRAGRQEPTSEEIHRVSAEFAALTEVLGSEIALARTNPVVRQRVRALLVPWLLKSRYWCSALLKTRGPGGDLQLLEWIYELEDGSGSNGAQDVVPRLLDQAFAGMGFVRDIWFRRAWCRDLIASTIWRLERPIRIMDVACAGSRYTRDALQLHPGSIRLAGIDADPAAIAYLQAMLPATALDRVGLRCAPIEHLPDLIPSPTLPEAGFDLVLATSVLDEFDDDGAVRLLRHMSNLTRPGGITAFWNASPDDGSRAIREWISSSPLHYRGIPEVLDLFPADRRALVGTAVSPDRTLICAWEFK
jgi:hypothetical protein